MKRAIALGLLTVLLMSGVGCFGTPQRSISPDTPSSFETFADWCRYRNSLTLEAQRTVGKVLEAVIPLLSL